MSVCGTTCSASTTTWRPGLALTGIVAYVFASSGMYAQVAATPLIWLIMLAPLGFVLAVQLRPPADERRHGAAAVLGFRGGHGLVAGLGLPRFTGASIARVFFITAGTFAAMSFYGYTTKRDLTKFGSFLMMGLIGIIIASIVNIFIGSSALQFAISVIGVIVFVGLTA